MNFDKKIKDGGPLLAWRFAIFQWFLVFYFIILCFWTK